MTTILCITGSYPPHHTGGYETSCRDVMERLVERGHDVTVLTSDDRLTGVPDIPDERNAQPAVRRDIIRYFRDDDLWVPSPVQRWKIERHNQRVIAETLADTQPDVVAVWHVAAFSLAIVTAVIEAGVPIVYAVGDDWPSYCTVLNQWIKLMERLGPLARPLGALLRVRTRAPDLGHSGAFCFNSLSNRERCERYSRWSFPLAAIVYSGFDRTVFRRDPDADGDRPWRWRLLYAGRYDPRKGIETVVRAMPLLPSEAVLQVRGTGDERERARLETIAADLAVSDRVEFSRGTQAELVHLYSSTDVVVFPSEWEEPFGLVPLEAMACDTPVVGTGTGGSGEFLVHERNCLRFTPGDPASLATAVRRLADDAELRARLVREGRVTAAYFDVERLTDALEAWYVAAANGYPDGPPPSRDFELGAADAEA
jgi:glycosyltransferase involved in cell wall biosynthesis